MQFDDLSSIDIDRLINSNSWQEKYRLILHWSDLIQPKPELHNPEYLLKGCEIDSWIKTETHSETRYFQFDSQSKLIKGLAAVILVQLNGQTHDYICNWNEQDFLQKSQLQKHMTPSRNNGLMALIRFCKNA